VRRIFLVTGRAGTGKTTWLMQKVNELASGFLTKKHHTLLAITWMHGARRRIQAKLRECCGAVPSSVSTIDGFALWILNRWRTALGYCKPIQAVSRNNADFVETPFGTEADFSRILTGACRLLESPTVRAILRETFPLIVIDEFQDCHGSLLAFVKALSESSTMLFAADDFQLLDNSVSGCPAVEWVTSLHNDHCAEICELPTCHRTSVEPILHAAKCLRDNRAASQPTIPVYCCPSEGPAAWKIIDALSLHYYSCAWKGSTAIICPSHDPFIARVCNSANKQLLKRGHPPIQWHEELGSDEEKERIRANIGLTTPTATRARHMSVPAVGSIEAHICARAERFARLRGLQQIISEVTERHVDRVVHEKRAYCAHCPSKVITTVHGAKNREFDNVFVLWPYTVPSDEAQRRKLLYNAITRSKKNCAILVWGNVARVQADAVLSLLGPAEPAIPPKSERPIRRKKETPS
jgi:hypothetical protein